MIIAILAVILGGFVGFISYKSHLKREWNNDFDKSNVYGSLFLGFLMMVLGIIALLNLIFE
jgi:hypothetical protein